MRGGVEISLIVAMAHGRVIGSDGDLPWHISEDLQFFKRKTMGCAIVMGRRTFESMGGALSGRENIIVSRSGFKAEGARVCQSLEAALDCGVDFGGGEIFVIGGGEIFDLSMGYADRIYVTEVDLDIAGDVYFPDFDVGDWNLSSGEWQEALNKRSGDRLRYRFLEYVRNK